MASAPVFARKTCPPFLLTFSANSSTSLVSATAAVFSALLASLMACMSSCFSFSRRVALFLLALLIASQNFSEDSLSFSARFSLERRTCLLLLVSRSLLSAPVQDDYVDRVGAVHAVEQPHLDVTRLAGS